MFQAVHARLIDISRGAVWIGGFALLIAAFIVTADVISRKIFNVTMSGSDEISGYVFAAATAWAYSFALLHRSNIRIDSLYNLLGLKVRACLDLLGLALLLYYAYVLTSTALEQFLYNWEYGASAQTTLATPLWIPQMFWVSGLCFFVLCLAFLTLWSALSIARGDFSTVNKIAGVPSITEEIDRETHVA